MIAGGIKNRDSRIKKFFVFVVILAVSLFTIHRSPITGVAHATNCPATDYDCQIAEIQREIDALKPAHEKNKQELANLRSQLDSLNKRITGISTQLKNVEAEINQREEDLAYTKAIFEEKTNNHYKFLRLYDPLLPFLSSNDAAEAFREINFRQKAADQDRKTMVEYAEELIQLRDDKATLEKNKASLASAQQKVAEQEKFMAGEVAKVESYLATLTARQQQFIAAKLGSLNLPTSLGAGPLYCTDDRNLEPNFRPAYAFYTFGIPHRVGMNQYGAYGRAKAGQNHEQILQAYFNGISFETRGDINISVEGYGSMSLETYLLGIYEMPGDWPIEALKAQAIAARSYALSYTNNGAKSICTSQSCQVYKGGNKGGNWETAVKETAGKVMVTGGQVITAWYASTAGAYTFTSADVGWSSTSWTKRLRDTTGDAGSFSDVQQSAYDKDSPCFYAAQGWRSEYGKSAWLKADEVADIANVILLARKDASLKPHLYQVDKPNPEGAETWDAGRVRQELGGSAISSATSVDITGVDWGSGQTTQVTVNGVSFSGTEWKDFFNLRAPANIQIVGPLFSVEKK